MNAHKSAFKYTQDERCEKIHATKAQLQAFGIGADVVAFPGEGKAPKKLVTVDPRGYTTRIECSIRGYFLASIHYPTAWPKTSFPSAHIDGLEPATDNGPYYDTYIPGFCFSLLRSTAAAIPPSYGRSGSARFQWARSAVAM